MAFKKFGTSDDQKVVADDNDTQGVSKTSSLQTGEKDRMTILRELQEEMRDTEE